jgi:hypothetical protein
MNAPKRTHQQKKVWVKCAKDADPPAWFREKVFGRPGARAAFTKVATGGLNEKLVWRALWELSRPADETMSRSSDLDSLPGYPLYTLQRFPDRVRGWETEIKNLEARTESSRDSAISVKSPLSD